MVIVAVLFPRSQELWRMWSRERPKLASGSFRKSGTSRKEARKYWGLSIHEYRRERFARGLNGGGRGAGRQLSLRNKAKFLVRLREFPHRVVYAGLRCFPSGRDWAAQAPVIKCMTSPARNPQSESGDSERNALGLRCSRRNSNSIAEAADQRDYAAPTDVSMNFTLPAISASSVGLWWTASAKHSQE